MTLPSTCSSVDSAREALCRELAGSLNAGNYTVRIRIVKSGHDSVAAHFYSHGQDGWQRHPEHLTDRGMLASLEETLGMLISTGHGDEWSVQRHEHSDGYDADFRFHTDKLKDRIGAKLESVLYGMLFRDQHASKKDERRAIRTPRPRAGGR